MAYYGVLRASLVQGLSQAAVERSGIDVWISRNHYIYYRRLRVRASYNQSPHQSHDVSVSQLTCATRTPAAGAGEPNR